MSFSSMNPELSSVSNMVFTFAAKVMLFNKLDLALPKKSFKNHFIKSFKNPYLLSSGCPIWFADNVF